MRKSLKTAVRSLEADCVALRCLAEERGALQHVATLVARGASPPVIFDAAATALSSLIKADYTAINRREADETMSVITLYRAPGAPEIDLPFGGRWTAGKDTSSAAVLRSHRPARRASSAIQSEIGAWLRSHGIGHVVACPVVVGDQLWGTMTALYLGDEPPPAGIEERMCKFVCLLNCAITQAETRAELIASRARLVTSADATRRRIERDLHDGAQQHLVSLAYQLRAAEKSVLPEQDGLRRQLSATSHGMSNVISELQEISRGLHPPLLAQRGLEPALAALVARSPIPVELNIGIGRRLPEEMEVTLYYLVSETLTNAIKHAHASTINVDLSLSSAIRLAVSDNGVGGADPTRGSGLIGLKDRAEALGGSIRITSPTGKGTTLVATIPYRA